MSRLPSRLCWDAAHAAATERGLSPTVADAVAQRTWTKYREQRIVDAAWPIVVVAELALYQGEA